MLKEKRAKNKISCKTKPQINVIRMQRIRMHNTRTYVTPYKTIFTIFYSIQRKMRLVGLQNVPRPFVVNEYSSQKIGYRIMTFSESAGFSCCRKLTFYGYNFRLDIKIFRTVHQGRDKSRNTTRALDTEY